MLHLDEGEGYGAEDQRDEENGELAIEADESWVDEAHSRGDGLAELEEGEGGGALGGVDSAE